MDMQGLDGGEFRESGLSLLQQDLRELDLRELGPEELKALIDKAERAHIRLSCRERTSPQQRRLMSRLLSLKTRCLLELREKERQSSGRETLSANTDRSFEIRIEDRKKARPRDAAAHSSLEGDKVADTARALGWHNRLFKEHLP